MSDNLIKDLYHKKTKKRIKALKTLAELENIEGLTEALKNDNIEVRFKAISLMENIEEDPIFEPLVNFLIKDINAINFAKEDKKEVSNALEILKPSKILDISHQLLTRIQEHHRKIDTDMHFPFKHKKLVNKEDSMRKILNTKLGDKQKREYYKFTKDVIEHYNFSFSAIGERFRGNYEEFFDTVIKKNLRVKVSEIVIKNTKEEQNLNYLANTLMDQRFYEEAIICFDKLLEINPNDEKSLFFKGYLMLNLNKEEMAYKCIEKVLEMNPEHEHAWYLKGKILHHLNMNREALNSINTALNINPNHFQARGLLAEIVTNIEPEKTEDWRELKEKKEKTLNRWKQLDNLISALREIYNTYKWKYKDELDWKDEEGLIRIQCAKGGWENIWHLWTEFGLEGSEFGILLWCTMEFSLEMMASPDFQRVGKELWYERKEKFDFKTIITPDLLNEDVLGECIQYIIEEKKKPSIVP